MSKLGKYSSRPGVRSTSPTSRTSGKGGTRLTNTAKVVIAAVGVTAVIGVASFIGIKAATSKDVDIAAFEDALISVHGGDLPAPPFIGWTQSAIQQLPEPLRPDDTIINVNRAECEPGGPRQAELDWLIMNEATKWSATELYNPAYNSQIRIDASNSHVESNGVDYTVVDRWLEDCGYVTFDQDNHTVRVTYKPLDVDMKVWNFDQGRAWIQTVSTTTPEGFQGSSSTITTIGNAPGVTLQAAITFRGRADDNAVATMDLLWSSQAAKALQAQRNKN